MEKKVGLLDQFEPEYGYDASGKWHGRTKADVERLLAEQREAFERTRFLHYWTPSSPAN